MASKRGPGYPGMSLPDAIERMRPVVKAEPHNEMTGEAVAVHLGYKGLSGASLAMIADMRRYGLLEGRGDKIKVSRDALVIITDEHHDDQTERAEALRRCAVSDQVFSKIASNYKGTPAQATLESYLIKNGFDSESSPQIALNYLDTIRFVEEQTKDYNPADGGEKPPGDPLKHNHAGMKNITLPLSVNTWATLTAPFPMDEAAWMQMVTVLNAMKPALVSSNQKPATDNKEEPA